MPAQTPESFAAFQGQIKAELAKAYEAKRLKLEELLAILYILGQAPDENTLRFFVWGFADSFPVLQQFTRTQEAGTKRDFELEVQKLVSRLIKTDPAQAVQLAKEAMREGATLEELKKKYNL